MSLFMPGLRYVIMIHALKVQKDSDDKIPFYVLAQLRQTDQRKRGYIDAIRIC